MALHAMHKLQNGMNMPFIMLTQKQRCGENLQVLLPPTHLHNKYYPCPTHE